MGMAEIGLSDAIAAVRAELAAAIEEGVDAEFQFPVNGVQLEFHVAVTKTGEGRAGVRFYVVELGGAGSYAREEIQTVTVMLGAPVDRAGEVVKVTRQSRQKP
jgi:Trypsin-co-occurring domain 2